jgi:hypothetical protein
MRYGSALPYIGRALMAGQQGAQGVYEGAITDFERQQKIEEFKRKQEQRKAQEQFLEQYAGSLPENQRAAFKAFPELGAKIAESSIIPKDRKYEKVGNQLIEVSGATPTVAFTGTDTSTQPSAVQEYQFALGQGYKGSFADWKKAQKSEGVTVNYGAPVAGVDAQGNPVFFQPSKTGGSPQIVPGVAPLREEKPATESQAKAAAFGSQMESASNEFQQIVKEGFAPGSATSQAQVELAGTPLRVFADPLAQRAQQSQEQWAEAFLRYKTGAAATAGEVTRNINTYFPKIGETDPKVIEQKARMRKQAEQDVLKSAKQPSNVRQPAQTAPAGRSRADILKQYGL